MMQVMPSRVAFKAGASRLYHNIGIFGLILGAFFAGAAWQNGKATNQVVHNVQSQYQGKLDYHLKNEKLVAKSAKSAEDACQHNLDAAIANDADAIRNCPPLPPVVKAIAASPLK